MKDWPISLRETGIVERKCQHGVGHPDPDSVAYWDRVDPKNAGYHGVHGCCGCCTRSTDVVAVLDKSERGWHNRAPFKPSGSLMTESEHAELDALLERFRDAAIDRQESWMWEDDHPDIIRESNEKYEAAKQAVVDLFVKQGGYEQRYAQCERERAGVLSLIRALVEQKDAYEKLINDDDTLMTHEDHITILRDAMHALSTNGQLVERIDALIEERDAAVQRAEAAERKLAVLDDESDEIADEDDPLVAKGMEAATLVFEHARLKKRLAEFEAEFQRLIKGSA